MSDMRITVSPFLSDGTIIIMVPSLRNGVSTNCISTVSLSTVSPFLSDGTIILMVPSLRNGDTVLIVLVLYRLVLYHPS